MEPKPRFLQARLCLPLSIFQQMSHTLSFITESIQSIQSQQLTASSNNKLREKSSADAGNQYVAVTGLAVSVTKPE